LAQGIGNEHPYFDYLAILKEKGKLFDFKELTFEQLTRLNDYEGVLQVEIGDLFGVTKQEVADRKSVLRHQKYGDDSPNSMVDLVQNLMSYAKSQLIEEIAITKMNSDLEEGATIDDKKVFGRMYFAVRDMFHYIKELQAMGIENPNRKIDLDEIQKLNASFIDILGK
jgi:hypothetical protein